MMMDDVAFIDTSFYFYFIFCNGKDSTFIKGFRRSFFCMIFSNLSHECESIMICKKLLSYLFSTILYLFFTKKPIRNSKKETKAFPYLIHLDTIFSMFRFIKLNIGSLYGIHCLLYCGYSTNANR